jgi:lysylphosphatidylglycerol synthetase-like protein (DUF2156 family)
MEGLVTRYFTKMYVEVLTFVDRFIVLCFKATAAQPAERHTRIFLMNQYAWWPIALLTFVTAWQHYISKWEAQLMQGNLSFISWWHLSAPSAICSQLLLVGSVMRHSAVYFRATCISYDTYVKYEYSRKCWWQFWCKFRDERVPSRQTTRNLWIHLNQQNPCRQETRT